MFCEHGFYKPAIGPFGEQIWDQINSPTYPERNPQESSDKEII